MYLDFGQVWTGNGCGGWTDAAAGTGPVGAAVYTNYWQSYLGQTAACVFQHQIYCFQD